MGSSPAHWPETCEPAREETGGKTRIIDAFVTNKLFGFPIFLAIMLFIILGDIRAGCLPSTMD